MGCQRSIALLELLIFTFSMMTYIVPSAPRSHNRLTNSKIKGTLASHPFPCSQVIVCVNNVQNSEILRV
ncbi:hypothetical protein P152DRAFT_92959 [Eremomyces bilateralis CBS 781.70]|uniref:Uncharacterized protein n=1 Tax=Eremomyces bilateralis CBS 781.70 TaxID=1392243 RepID=A0A6G1FXV1_9PEZI|nr:uncharacterized protein P152DRAFT_92959 [Eremomyces bilateralis CBS 781.70]KAF1810667.1 hypothetical protein P152DRAFT_92959 [Eremomyces bilateralis CBS 781.70]